MDLRMNMKNTGANKEEHKRSLNKRFTSRHFSFISQIKSNTLIQDNEGK